MSDNGFFDVLTGLGPVFKVWKEPNPAHVYSLGVDTSEGLGHGDNSAIAVLDNEAGEQVAMFVDRCPPDVLALQAYRMARWYADGLLVVEANNHGVATLAVLRQLGYESLFRRRQINHVRNTTTEEYGFKTTRTTKPLIISQLDEALRNGEVVLHEVESIIELKGYVRDDKGRMGGSPFDDRVIALALAHHGRAFLHQRRVEPKPRDDYMTGGWWERLLRDEDDGRLVVGRHNRRGGTDGRIGLSE